jgi:large subunit ribosomal protein L4
VHLLFPDQLNTYDVLISDDVVFTKAALDDFLAFQRVSVITADELAEIAVASDAPEVTLSKSAPAASTDIDDAAADEIDGIAPGTVTEEKEDDK